VIAFLTKAYHDDDLPISRHPLKLDIVGILLTISKFLREIMADILVVDPNEAFATLLTEELRRQEHQVVSALSYDEALGVAQSRGIDLALIDMGLDGPGAVALAQGLREMQPQLRLVFIPLIGEDLAPEVGELIVYQGILPKPFFLPELPDRIDLALQVPLAGETEAEAAESGEEPEEAEPPLVVVETVAETADSPVEPAPAPHEDLYAVRSTISADLVARHQGEIERALRVLAREIGADAVLLTVGDAVAASAAQMQGELIEVLAETVTGSWKRSLRVAHILDRAQTHFEFNISGGDYSLYAVSVDGDTILTVALRSSTPLGLLRHQARGAAEEIAYLCRDGLF
jgi:CheY-like chemotaxis protein